MMDGDPAPPRPASASDEPGPVRTIAGDLAALLARALYDTPVVPCDNPSLGWFVVSLIRYRERQRWLCQHLGDLVPHRGPSLQRDLPCAPGWQLLVYGRSVEAQSPASGERISVSVDEDALDGPGRLAPDTMRGPSVGIWIQSLMVGGGPDAALRGRHSWEHPETFIPCVLPDAQLPEARTWRWLPSTNFLIELVAILGRAGVLEGVPPPGANDSFRFGPDLEALAAAVAAEDFADRRVAARWARHLGDAEIGSHGHDRPRVIAAHRASLQRFLFAAWDHKATLLPILARQLTPAELVWTCDALLDGPEFEPVLAFLRHRSYLPTSQGVARLLRALPLEGSVLRSAQLAIEYLQARGAEPGLAIEKVVAFGAVALDAVADAYADAAAQTEADAQMAAEVWADLLVGRLLQHVRIALGLAPEYALQLVRRALRSDHELVVEEVTALLVVADRPWCVRELALAYHDRPPHVDVLRQALGLLRQPPDGVPPFIGRNKLTARIACRRTDPQHWNRDIDPR